MTQRKNADSLDTLFAQANGAIDEQTGGVVPPIQSATTFVRDADNVLHSANNSYARDDNDLVRLGESILSRAEHAEAGLLLPSGMAAVASVMRTVPNGGCIILQTGIYWGATKWIREFCQRRQVELIELDCADFPALQSVAKPADILWVETPSNPYLKTVGHCRLLAIGTFDRGHSGGRFNSRLSRFIATSGSRRRHSHAFCNQGDKRAQRCTGWLSGLRRCVLTPLGNDLYRPA